MYLILNYLQSHKMLIDAHCHLDHHLYLKDLNKVIERAKKSGVKKIIAAGIDFQTNKNILEIKKRFEL